MGYMTILPVMSSETVQKVEMGAEKTDQVESDSQGFLKKYKIKRDKKRAEKEAKKIVQAKNKLDYINLPWFENFNDDNLNRYIIKAVLNNKDAQMATIAVDEYYQAARAQMAGELPTVNAGFLPAYTQSEMLGPYDGWFFGLPILVNY